MFHFVQNPNNASVTDYNSLRNKPLIPSHPSDIGATSLDEVRAQASVIFLELAVESWLKQNADSWYEISLPKNGENAEFDENGKVIKIHDLTLSQAHAEQVNTSRQPHISSTTQNKRRFLSFDGQNDGMLTAINLNSPSVSVFCLYRIADHRGKATNGGLCNGLFGHDNGGWDKFVAFDTSNQRMVVSGSVETRNSGSGAPRALGVLPQDNANPYQTQQWNLVSIHWNGTSTSNSEVWCNGKKLEQFTNANRTGSNAMILADLNPKSLAAFHGDIAEFIVARSIIPEDTI
jgi:hypothetical protein